MKNLYVPCHLHTTGGSIGDSIVKIPELVKKAKEYELPALCVTNHGSLADMVDFYFECKKENIKPIIGCEVYTTSDMTYKEKDAEKPGHLVLLAKNNQGLKNLLTITADSQLKGFYYKPRVDFDYLESIDTSGIIATTACVGSKVNQLIINDKLKEAEELIRKLDNIFEDFFLEIQPGEFREQVKVNKELINFSRKLDIPLIASNDIHYVLKEDYLAHDNHVKSHRKLKYDGTLCYPDKCYYLMTKEELIDNLSKTVDRNIAEIAVDNTMYLNEVCDLSLAHEELNLPEFDCPKDFTPQEYLEYICLQRLEQIKDKIKDPAEYIDRIYMELEVINVLGFTSYYLIVRDFLEFAKAKKIPYGPGRGSVCGSLVAYLAGLTKIDPIKYDLLFDRFLSIFRTGSIPDVDLDFASDRRQEMFDYVVDKYGADYCAAVSTFQIRKARSAIKDACRILEIEEGDAIAKLIPMTHYDEEGDKMTDLSIEESLRVVPELQEYQTIYPEMFEMAIKIENLPRATSIHAAGTLIAKTPLHDLIPMIKKDDSLLNATSLDLSQAEKMKLVKYDFLGLATLSVINEVEKATNDVFDIEFDRYNDEAVWELIGSRNTTGLFQIASSTYKQRMGRLKPHTIEELAACLALVRGPCIAAKTDEKYMRILEGKEEVELIHPIYDEAVKDTYGIMIYQEQLMACCANFGLPLHEGYDLMKASAKKKFDKLKAYEDKLWELAQEKDMDRHTFDRIFKMIVDSGLYSFNKSHAVAYAVLCYVTAYHKIYHPKEYLAAELSNIYISVAADKRKDRVAETVKECRRLGIKFSKIDVSKSKWKFTVEDDTIRIGMCAISSFGEKAYNALMLVEDKSDLETIYEEVNKTVCNKKAFNALIFAGAFGDISENYNKYCALRQEEPSELIVFHKNLKLSIYDDDKDMEEGLLGYNFIHNITNTLDPIGYKELKNKSVFETTALLTRVSKKKDKNNNMMAWVTIETGDGAIEGVVFANVYAKCRSLLKKNALVKIKGKKDNDTSCLILEVA